MSADSSCSEALDLSESNILRIVRNDSGSKSAPNGYVSGQKFSHFDSVTLLAVEEVQAVSHFPHGDGIFLSPVFENKLLEEQEGALVLNFLSDLNEGFPGVFGSESCTVWTLCILDEELDLEDLL
jgi:hypothetical protein